MKTSVKCFYALFGLLYLAAGASVLLFHTGWLPESVAGLIRDVSHNDPNTIHILQEFGSLLIFVGLITFWFIVHYERSLMFHWSMTAFWGLFAFIHWHDIRGQYLSVNGPLATTVPVVLFVVMGLLRLCAGSDSGPR